jgi:hypothetical protein
VIPRSAQLLVFWMSWVTFGWFHQGGGWNQNARFAQVRAIVEQGTLAVDDYFVWFDPERSGSLKRMPAYRFNIFWPRKDARSEYAPVHPPEALRWGAEIGTDTCSGDVAYAPNGHFYPNKPPGISLLAVPAYFAIYHFERALKLDPDDAWIMTVNAWLTSALTVGLISAWGVVLMLRLGARLFPGRTRAALAAALACGFGTTFFPFGTMLFDHNVTAVLLLASFADVRGGKPGRAGLWAGIATLTNYLAAIPGAAFGVWALTRSRASESAGTLSRESTELKSARAFTSAATVVRFTLGVLPSAIALLWHNEVCFGSPWTLSTAFQNPLFKETAPALFGMFTLPSWFAALCITVSPWRGLFVLCPVMILAVVALFRSRARESAGNSPQPSAETGSARALTSAATGGWPAKLRAERRLILFVAGFFFLVNISFNGFHGGMSSGPRYLIPALPFLALALVPAFARWKKTAAVLMTASIAQQTLLTATDAMCPVGVHDMAWQNHPDEWKEKLWGNSIVWKYALPLWRNGIAQPVLDAEISEWEQIASVQVEKISDLNPHKAFYKNAAKLWPEYFRRDPESALRDFLKDGWGIKAFPPDELRVCEVPPIIAAFRGPVSVNRVAVWQGTLTDIDATAWHSFNIGEFQYPGSRWSVALLAFIWLGGWSLWVAIRKVPES